jgi:hypothetical protein
MNEEFRDHLDQLWVDATAHRCKPAEVESHFAFTRLVEALMPVANSLQVSFSLRDPQLTGVTQALGSVLLGPGPKAGDLTSEWDAYIRAYERRLSSDSQTSYVSAVYELFENIGELAKAQRTLSRVLVAKASVKVFVHVGYMSFMIREENSDD